jgi:hypothetical protein
MEKEELIKRAYETFSLFEKPDQCTKYTDFEDLEFNEMLLSTDRRGLTAEQAGTSAWSPLPSMTPEAVAYFMPRLIELAVTNALDRDGEPFFCLFINSFSGVSNDDRFSLFRWEHRSIMADAFRFLCSNLREQLKIEGWLDEACMGEEIWRSEQYVRKPI